MKKIINVLLTLIILLIPVNSFALTKTVEDMSITFDNDYWYTFTRDNIENNSELSELGLDYEQVKEHLESNDLYLDSILYDDDPNATIELMIGIKPVGDSDDINELSDSDLRLLGQGIKEQVNADSYSIKTINGNKYIYLDYYDSNINQNTIEYYTFVNGKGYTILIRKQTEYNEEDMLYIDKSINSISFSKVSNVNDNNIDNLEIILFIILLLLFFVLIILYFYLKKKILPPKIVKVIEVIGVILVIFQIYSLSTIDTTYLFSKNNTDFEDYIYIFSKISYLFGYLYFGIIGFIILAICKNQIKQQKNR